MNPFLKGSAWGFARKDPLIADILHYKPDFLDQNTPEKAPSWAALKLF